MDGEIEDVMPAVSVERTEEGSREHDEVIGFLLQDGSGSGQVSTVPGAGDHMIKQLEGGEGGQADFVIIKDEKKSETETSQENTSMDTNALAQPESQSGDEQQLQTISLAGEPGDQETGTATVQLMSGGQTLQVRVPTYQQAITLPDGTTAFIQQPVLSNANKGEPGSGMGAMKLVEGQAIELEDGTMAYVQNTPKLGDGLQAIQLEDGTTAYISQSAAATVFNDGSALEATSLNLENLRPQEGESEMQEGPRVLHASLVSSPQRMSSERALALGDKAYKCAFEGCGRLYTTQHHLKVHARSHTGDRPFRCEFAGCGKAFATGYGLKSHTRVHTGEKPYKCPEEACNKAFKTSGDLQKHVRTHTGERPFKCPFEGCTRSFTTSNIRKVHIRTHTGERPYVCTEEGCMKAFASATNYKNHIRIHTGEKPYVCTVSGCGKRFTEYSSLYKHHVVHTHSKPYICNHCGKNYRQTSTLAMHKRTAHGDDSSVEADAALLLQQTEGDLTGDAMGNGKQQRVAFQLVPPGMLQATTASTAVSQEDSEGGALIINTSEPQQLTIASDSSHNTATTVAPTVITDDQALAALQVSQQAAHVAIQQLQQGHGITLGCDQDGQQIYVVADPAQLEALQQLAQQQNLVIPPGTEVTNIALESQTQGEGIAKEEGQDDATTAQQDVSADPLTADEEEDHEDVLQYEVSAS